MCRIKNQIRNLVPRFNLIKKETEENFYDFFKAAIENTFKDQVKKFFLYKIFNLNYLNYLNFQVGYLKNNYLWAGPHNLQQKVFVHPNSVVKFIPTKFVYEIMVLTSKLWVDHITVIPGIFNEYKITLKSS